VLVAAAALYAEVLVAVTAPNIEVLVAAIASLGCALVVHTAPAAVNPRVVRVTNLAPGSRARPRTRISPTRRKQAADMAAVRRVTR
jgi:hypothetical protein